MSVTPDRNSKWAGPSAVLICLVVGACGNSAAGSRSGPELSVTVASGMDSAQADMQVGNSPAARYLAGSGTVVYVSPGLYSSTCPPKGTATVKGDTITLTVKDAEGNCTADAGRDTFRIEHVTGQPSRLVVKQAGERDIRLHVSK